MATLEKIRNQGGLLVTIIIGLALLAFILGDILNSAGTSRMSNDLTVAEVFDNELNVQDYQNRLNEVFDIYRQNRGDIDEETSDQLTNQTWEDFIREAVLEPAYDAYGISVSVEEMKEMVQGENLHPIIVQVFGDPNTGEVNKEGIRNFIANINGEFAQQKPFWLYIEKEIYSKRKITKYNNLVKKAIYTPTLQADLALKGKASNANVEFVVKSKAEIADSLVSYTEADVKAYYEKNKEKFNQANPVRDIMYVTYDVIPSAQDNQDALLWINGIVNEFSQSTNDAAFVNLNGDDSFNDQFFAKGQLDLRLDTIMFNQEAGYVFGPYFENMTYKLAKLSKIEQRPDSVKASHILIRNENNDPAVASKAASSLDSLKRLVEAGASFADLARTNSQDGSAQAGGDLGWFTETMMVKPFSEACFSGKKGDLVIVQTQFGQHLIQINELSKLTKKVQIAYLTRKVEASTQTYQDIYAKASTFSAENRDIASFNNAVSMQALVPRTATVMENDRKISGLEQPRELIKWAFEAEKGNVSEVFEFGNRFVVATLANVKESGVQALADVKTQVEAAVIAEKKGEYLLEKFNSALSGGATFESLQTAVNGKRDVAQGINFDSFQIPGYGTEHEVIAHISVMKEGEVSKPIVGQNAVFVVKVTARTQNPAGDLSAEQKRINTMKVGSSEMSSYDALKKLAGIQDYRSKWF